MKQTCLVNAKEDEKGIAGQARNDKPFRMKQHYVHLLIISFTLFLSCTNKNKEIINSLNSKVIKVDLDSNIGEKNVFDISASVTMLRLEEDSENPIGVIDRMIITNTRIYILDSQRAKSLFIYDREGYLKNVICHIGNGPGEYVNPGDFDIEKNTGNIIILDKNQRKLLYYTKEGNSISDLSFKNTYISSFCTTNNDELIFDKGNFISDESNNYIRIVDHNGETIKELLSIPEYAKEITISPRNPFQKMQNTVLFLPSLSKEVYQIVDNQIALRYQFDFGKLWPNEAYFKSKKGKHPLQIAQDLEKDKYISFINFLESKDVIHSNFYSGDKLFSYYYNKNSDKSILFYSTDQALVPPIAISESSFVCAQYIEDHNPGLIFFDIKWD
jgi:hypothetical protein